MSIKISRVTVKKKFSPLLNCVRTVIASHSTHAHAHAHAHAPAHTCNV